MTTPKKTLIDPALQIAADILDDLERVRIANENRVRIMTRTETDKDGGERGWGLSEDHPEVAPLLVIVTNLRELEKQAVANLEKRMKAHPLGPWIKGVRGVGLKQGARLLASIGDPYWRPDVVYVNPDPDKKYEDLDRSQIFDIYRIPQALRRLTVDQGDGTFLVPAGPRTVQALWAFSGLHTVPVDAEIVGQPDRNGRIVIADDRVSARRRKGHRANWSTTAKTRAYLISESCIKQLSAECREGHVLADGTTTAQLESWSSMEEGGQIPAIACSCSPFRIVYDRRKTRTKVTRPEWTDGHRHNDALRKVSQELLKELWKAARAWHEKNEKESS